MNIQRLSIVLSVIAIVVTAINLVILMSGGSRGGVVTSGEVAPMLRGRGLEIVDENGKRRAEIIVTPPTTMPDGKTYPESVLLRLIDRNGRPGVKIGTGVDGSGISLAGDSERRDWNGIQILAEQTGSLVKLTNKDGRIQIVQP